MPRSQDISNYPSLALHKSNLKDLENVSVDRIPLNRKRSPTRRTQSEDVYNERTEQSAMFSMSSTSSGETQLNERPVRINPLMKLAESKPKDLRNSPRRKQRSDSSGESNVVEDTTDNKSKGKQCVTLLFLFEYFDLF